MHVVSKETFQKIDARRVHGSSVARVGSQYNYVKTDDSVEDVADSFIRHPEVLAVGVVDSNMRLVGVIQRSDLFHRLGKPYGRDILGRKPITDVAENNPTFYYESNVFNVAEKVSALNSERQRIRFFGLVDDKDGFVGLFSSMDILSYLASLTQQDISLAGMLQERMQHHDDILKGENCSCIAISKYAKGMGGDFHFLLRMPDGRILMALCDVSGKGAAASIITGMLWGMMKVYDYSRGLVQLVKDVNRAVIEAFRLEKYLTGIFAIYNEKTRELVLADMGHGHLCVGRNGKVREVSIAQSNLPVGIELDIEPQLSRLRLKPGDTLAIVTDGLIEQQNIEGQEQNIETWLAGMQEGDLLEYCNDLIQRFNEYRRGVVQLDDVSVMLLRAEA